MSEGQLAQLQARRLQVAAQMRQAQDLVWQLHGQLLAYDEVLTVFGNQPKEN